MKQFFCYDDDDESKRLDEKCEKLKNKIQKINENAKQKQSQNCIVTLLQILVVELEVLVGVVGQVEVGQLPKVVEVFAADFDEGV